MVSYLDIIFFIIHVLLVLTSAYLIFWLIKIEVFLVYFRFFLNFEHYFATTLLFYSQVSSLEHLIPEKHSSTYKNRITILFQLIGSVVTIPFFQRYEKTKMLLAGRKFKIFPENEWNIMYRYLKHLIHQTS